MDENKKFLFDAKINYHFPNYKENKNLIDLPNDKQLIELLIDIKRYKLVDIKTSKFRTYNIDYYLIFNIKDSTYDIISIYHNVYNLWSKQIMKFCEREIMLFLFSETEYDYLITCFLNKLNFKENFAFYLGDKREHHVVFDIVYVSETKDLYLKNLRNLQKRKIHNYESILDFLIMLCHQQPLTSDEFRQEIKRINDIMFKDYQSKVETLLRFLKNKTYE